MPSILDKASRFFESEEPCTLLLHNGASARVDVITGLVMEDETEGAVEYESDGQSYQMPFREIADILPS